VKSPAEDFSSVVNADVPVACLQILGRAGVANTERELGDAGASTRFPFPVGEEPTRRGVGRIGLIVIIVGFGLVVFSYLSPNWISSGFAGHSYTAANLRHAPHVTGIAAGYFNWIGWLMLLATTGFAAGGAFPIVMREASARVAAFLGVLSGAMTLAVLSDLAAPKTLGSFWKYVAVGPYLAIAGFLVIAIGGFIAT
jgi:hypothetical protein